MTRGPARPAVARTALAATLLSLATTGCVTERRKTVAYLEEGAFAPPDVEAALVGGAGRAARGYRRPRSGSAAALDRPGPTVPDVPAGPGEAARAPVVAVDPGARVESAPVKTSAAPPAHEPIADVATLERRRRETFLTCTTTLRAEKVTLFVPPRYAAEAVFDGASRLTLRRLTVEARQLKLVARTDGSEDVSISARGDVSFHADRPASVITETGLKTLLVRNEGYTPLR